MSQFQSFSFGGVTRISRLALDMAQDERAAGNDDRAAMFKLEAKVKLLVSWERSGAIDRAGRRLNIEAVLGKVR